MGPSPKKKRDPDTNEPPNLPDQDLRNLAQHPKNLRVKTWDFLHEMFVVKTPKSYIRFVC